MRRHQNYMAISIKKIQVTTTSRLYLYMVPFSIMKEFSTVLHNRILILTRLFIRELRMHYLSIFAR